MTAGEPEGSDLRAQVLETWRTNNRINLFLIDQISDEGMQCTLSKRGGRNVVGARQGEPQGTPPRLRRPDRNLFRRRPGRPDQQTQYAIWNWDKL
jgi:hypothetical protein